MLSAMFSCFIGVSHHVDPSSVCVGDSMPVRDVRLGFGSVYIGGDYDAYAGLAPDVPGVAWVAVDGVVVASGLSFDGARSVAEGILFPR